MNPSLGRGHLARTSTSTGKCGLEARVPTWRVVESIHTFGASTGYYISGPRNLGFRRSYTGVIAKIVPSDAKFSHPLSINEKGAITGWYFEKDHICHGFVWTP